ncbi:Unconventional myosin-IXa [Triplophysa tibetana]|uniref:Unconventional myosin-IXa n=1 Tax=Triplophysa tibetana TaxID=1572043 RepID=A0A5A9PW24_9TELE|nr:Unconventional myosin-IXa [Triplophysa tibetana]
MRFLTWRRVSCVFSLRSSSASSPYKDQTEETHVLLRGRAPGDSICVFPALWNVGLESGAVSQSPVWRLDPPALRRRTDPERTPSLSSGRNEHKERSLKLICLHCENTFSRCDDGPEKSLEKLEECRSTCLLSAPELHCSSLRSVSRFYWLRGNITPRQSCQNHEDTWNVVNPSCESCVGGTSRADGSCYPIMSCHDAGGRRRYEDSEFTLRIYPGALSEGTIYCPIAARKVTSAAEVIEQVIDRLQLDRARLYVLAEVKEFGGEEWILNPNDCPVQRVMLWPRMALENRLGGEDYRFLLREKNVDGSIHYGSLQMWLRVTEERRRMVERGLLPQPPAGQYVADLCSLPDLNERMLLENLRGRFRQEKIYTYVGEILIVVNPFQFLPIYNPKYVKMYDNHRLGKLEPHIYAVADVAYHTMLQRKRNQCIVISGESGSGKTQSTNFLIHHLTALSQKGFASGVEQIILGAGPVLEAFGNAKTAHNNNSSRFGKFIQVNYQESGTVRGAYVEKYLLEKSRLVYQEHNERNYHVFYYLLAGASEEERKSFHLLKPEEYHYLNQVTLRVHRHQWRNECDAELDCFSVEGEDLKHDFERLQLAMEMVGFLPATKKLIFSLLSAILHLGNIRYKKKTYRDDSIDICNPEVLPIVSELLEFSFTIILEKNFCQTHNIIAVKHTGVYKYGEMQYMCIYSQNFCVLMEADVSCPLSVVFVYSRLSYTSQHLFRKMKRIVRTQMQRLYIFKFIILWCFYEQVKEEMLFEALTTRKTVTVGERLIVPYKLSELHIVSYTSDKFQQNIYFRPLVVLLEVSGVTDTQEVTLVEIQGVFTRDTMTTVSPKPKPNRTNAGTVRDSMAKSLYGALFDWIVFRTNHALLYNKDLEDSSKEEYRSEGISWHMIDYIDNTPCINLISKKPTALLHLLDEECNFPQATNQTLLDKFKRQHEASGYIEFPAVMEPAFIIRHYAGKVKYGVKDFREKNTDHMRPDIVALLKSSRNAFICGLMGIHPVATFRWAVLRAFFRGAVAFREAGKQHKDKNAGSESPVLDRKSVDSFSFLHHPVHQRSLEILQRCKDDRHSSCISRKMPRTPLSDLQGTNTLTEKLARDGFSGCNVRSVRERISSFSSAHVDEGIFVNSVNNKLLERAQGILMRNKNYKTKLNLPKHLLDVKSLKYLSCLTLHDRITKSLLHLHKKKKPPSISAQFNVSLNKLMETLGQSEPYFVKCIRSNAEKLPLRFNDALVLRQLRYTGMLETVRIRQSGYSVKYTFPDFAHHFHLLLPAGFRPAQMSIREFLRTAHIDFNTYQVGRTMVFLREMSRQKLQDELHQEVLRRIVCLQRRFRGHRERKLFSSQRRAARLIQRWWRECLMTHATEHLCDLELQHEAAVCLQVSWRGYRERRLYALKKNAALVIQRRWRRCLRTRETAAGLIQTTWRTYRQRRRYLQQCRAAVTLQAACRGHQSRQRCHILQEELRLTKSLNTAGHQNSVMKSLHVLQETAEFPIAHMDPQTSGSSAEDPPQEEQEPSAELPRIVDDSTLKSRNKRESRRKRELEQATFSLELLKVRSGSLPNSDQTEISDNLLPVQDTECVATSPQASLDSQESFEILNVHDEEVETSEHPHQMYPSERSEPMEVHQIEDSLDPVQSTSPFLKPRFYIPDEESSPVKSVQRTPTSGSQVQEKKESVIVIISMQKENSVEQKSPETLQKLEKETVEIPAAVHQETFPEDRWNGEAILDLPNLQSTPKPPTNRDLSTSLPTSQPLQLDRRAETSVQEVTSESKKEAHAQKKVTQSISISMKEKPSNLAFPSKRSRLTFSKSDKDLVNQERSLAIQREAGYRSLKNREVTGAVRKKKARMAGTRSDFLTRACSTEVDSNEDEDEEYEYRPVLSRTQTLPESLDSLDPVFDSDSEMNAFPTCFVYRVRGKMRFWSKSKHGDKKMSSRGHSADSELTDRRNNSSPGSPEHAGLPERGKDSKENREPLNRRRSVKISSVSLESNAWQNDSLHILTSTTDYRCMNDFLMKKISDLDAEDCQKDSPVDVVFKKALKEFRLNIFDSYSTSLAMDDGRSIRYKDLNALFEHILEKSMRLEQRAWSESPVKVWVNTFKIFLDEFMTEYKPMDGTISKAPKPERKKRRKKESDIVEEHMGHIFKSTQYSIPTYCEFCSSLIWMMDKACVCKLCRYACHRKCCLRMTTKCSKKFDPEQSSRQFGVELTRLTSDERTVPLVVEKLINYIEMHGLYTEGIYRKSGSTNKIKELKQGLDTDVNGVNLDDYNIHVIASVLKQWLRDLPNPLMTFELYEEFLRAMGLQDKREIVQSVYAIIDQLSRTHLSTLERLLFHLVRILFQEETNRMSANALAIVFAPCILRCPDTIDPLQSVRDISKTTACVELIICEQMRKYKARLKDINTLEFAESKAKSRLTHIRRSMKPVLIAVRFIGITRTATPSKARLRKSGLHTPSPPLSPRMAEREESGEEGAESGMTEQQQAAMQQEESVLTQQIENLQKEKEELTYEMLALEPRASDDEMLESEASIGTADSSENLMESEEKCSGARCRKPESKSRRGLRRQPESLDSVDSVSSVSSTPNYRFRSSSSGPLFSSASPGDLHVLLDQGASEQDSLTTRCASSSEKTRPRPRGNRSCPPKTREPGEGGVQRREHEFGSAQPLVLYGSNEFMV